MNEKNNRKRCDNLGAAFMNFKGLFFMIFMLTLATAMSFNVLAANPGHGAASVSAGTFEAGNFTFPNSVKINDNLNISDNFYLYSRASCTKLYTDASGFVKCGTDNNTGIATGVSWIVAGTGLTGGNISSTGTIALNTTYLQRYNFSTKANTGSCSAGQYVVNTTTSGVQCLAEVGDISGVTAGTGLTGGGASGAVTLNLNTTYLQRYNDSTKAGTGDCPSGQYVQNTTTAGVECAVVVGTTDLNNYTSRIGFSGTTTKTLNLTRSGMVNISASFTDMTGITSLTAGTGLTGGTITTTGTIAVNTTYLNALYNDSAAVAGRAAVGDCPSGQYVQNTTTAGVECAVAVAATDLNNYTSGIAFTGTGTKTLNLARSGMSNITAQFTDLGTAWINAGTGLTGGNITTGGTIALNTSYLTSYIAARDLNNYSTSMAVTGTTTKTIQIARNGMTNISAQFTDLNTLGALSCSDGQIAKWNATSSAWYCAADQYGTPGTGISWINFVSPGLTGGNISVSGAVNLNYTYLKSLYNDSSSITTVNNRVTALNNTKALAGNCPSGQFVQNATATALQCLAEVGDISAVTAGTGLTGGGTTGAVTLNLNTTYVNSLVSAGELNNYTTSVAFTGTTTKTLQVARSGMANVSATFTDLQGVTSVTAGTGLTGGIITSTGTIALNTTYMNNIYNYTSEISAVNQTAVNKAGTGDCPSGQFVQNTTTGGVECVAEVGDISAVTAGTGLTGGGASGAVTLNLNTTYMSRYNDSGSVTTVNDRITAVNNSILVRKITTQTCSAGSYFNTFTNGTNIFTCTAEVGDISAVVAGTGLTGGATSGSATVNINTTYLAAAVAGYEVDTLATVTGRGATTTANVTIDSDSNGITKISGNLTTTKLKLTGNRIDDSANVQRIRFDATTGNVYVRLGT